MCCSYILFNFLQVQMALEAVSAHVAHRNIFKEGFPKSQDVSICHHHNVFVCVQYPPHNNYCVVKFVINTQYLTRTGAFYLGQSQKKTGLLATMDLVSVASIQ